MTVNRTELKLLRSLCREVYGWASRKPCHIELEYKTMNACLPCAVADSCLADHQRAQ